MGNLCCNSETGQDQDVLPRITQEQENQKQLKEQHRQAAARIQQQEECRQAESRRKEQRQGQAEAGISQEQERQRLEKYRQAKAQKGQLEQAESFPTIPKILENHEAVSNWVGVNSQLVRYVRLSSTSKEYKNVIRQFRITNKKCFRVLRIERVENPYLLGTYLLKKEELLSRYGSTKETLLFHGTKEKHVDNICKNNFDWRMNGKMHGHAFGKGVYFTPISNYATHYCDTDFNIKVMLLVKVLVSNSCLGNVYMNLPPDKFDTSKRDNGHAVVKYYDNEFYPAYKIYFHTLGGDDVFEHELD